MCVDVSDDAETCPVGDDVDVSALYSLDNCDLTATRVTGDGTLEENAFAYLEDSGASPDLVCCYPVRARDDRPFSECMIGRPYLETDLPVVAPLEDHDGWCAADGARSPVEAQDEALAEALAEAWRSMGRMEHASIAAFARLTLDLMACGAPAALLAAVQQAAADEVAHAQACFAIAARLSGQPRSPGAMSFADPIVPCGDLVSLAVAATREGCMGETLGAALAAASAQRAQDPQIRATLETIAADEARHAALSWRIVAWAIQAGGPLVRAAVADAFQRPLPLTTPAFPDSANAEAMGVLSADAQEAIFARALREVVAPARRVLLAA